MIAEVRLGRVVVLGALLVVACQPATTTAAPPARRPAPPPPSMSAAQLEAGLLAQLNAARTDPARYAARLEARLPHYRGLLFQRPSDRVATRTSEGAAAVREAIAALRGLSPRVALARSAGMSHGARDHVTDQG
ncbi:MAG TPA: hypothetical protein VEA99_07630, partial [Gemmatimonadaceae bacterium]|nr:hypothetical protein [Gemmatimonadaceae bacterium]